MRFNDLIHLEKLTIAFVLGTITEIRGSAPQDLGAKCIITKDGLYSGTVGGGKIEAHVIQYAKKQLESAENKIMNETWNLQKDIGMTCGGVVQVFFEVYRHDQWNIAVFGAGHVAQALVPLLLTLSCQVHCIDHRKEWLQQLPEHPALSVINLNDLALIIKQLPKNCYVVSVTQGHCEDVKIIEQLLKDRTPPYIGIIGSDSKSILLKKELHAAGVSKTLTQHIQCPIGLPFGDDIPAEIAISIAAQLLTTRDQQNVTG